jgi:hypothetical protein
MAENRTQYSFSFEKPFQLYTDTQLLEMVELCPSDEEAQASLDSQNISLAAISANPQNSEGQ